MIRKTSILLIVLLAHFASAQNCVQNLDSAVFFKYTNQEKAKFYANTLLADLDSSKCVTEMGIAQTYNNVGLLLWEINEKTRGLYALKRGITQELESKDSLDRALIGPYYNLATLYQEIGSFKEAGKYLSLAERVVNSSYTDDTGAVVRLLFKKGIYYREVGSFNESLDALNRAIRIKGSSQDSTMIALQVELGTTYKHFGDLEQSEVELLKAVELAKQTDEVQYLIAIDRLSTLKMEQGEYSDSENFLLYNLKQKQEKYSSDPILALETLNGLSILYHRLNDLEAADEYMNQALDIAENVPGHTSFSYQ